MLMTNSCRWLLVCCLIIVWAKYEHDDLPLCSPSNLKVGDVEKAVWYLEPDGTLKLGFIHCKLRQFSADKAKKCLLSNHIVFMGDSLSRYFYLSLATLLATGAWSPKLTHRTSKSFPPSILSEGDFSRWADFYKFTNQALNDVRTSSYEVCDCFRDDMLRWDDLPEPVGCPAEGLIDGFCNQQESCVENRHFRSYMRAAPSVSSGAAAGSLGEGAVVKLSFLQFYGSMPFRGRSALSLKLPDSEDEFQRYVQTVSDKLCPAALNTQPRDGEKRRFPPPVFYTQTGNLSAVEELHFWSEDPHYNNAHSARHRRPATNSLLPMTWECGLTLRALRDSDKSPARLDMPGLYDDLSGAFERAVLRPLRANHLLVNIGFHSSLVGYEENQTMIKEWLHRRVTAAKDNFQVHSGQRPGQRLALPQVVWRGTTAFAPFAGLNDRNAREVRDQLRACADDGLELGVMDIYSMTARLWGLHRLAAQLGGAVDLLLLRAIELGAEQHYIPPSGGDNSTAGSSETTAASAWAPARVAKFAAEWRGLNIRLGSKLNSTAAHLAAALKVHVGVAEDGSKAAAAQLRRARLVEHARWLKLPAVYVDMAHPQPWVYNEINNVFLNSACV